MERSKREWTVVWTKINDHGRWLWAVMGGGDGPCRTVMGGDGRWWIVTDETGGGGLRWAVMDGGA